MFKVALVGAGNLGSRHLQALKQIQMDVSIFVSEPSKEAREIASIRYSEIPENSHIKSIEYMDDYKMLPKDTDLAIIATSSNVRFQIAKWIVENMETRYLVLEKVVFQSIKEFDEFDKIIKHKSIKIWVNCPRRMFSFYKELHKKTITSSNVDVHVVGSDWGLACNGIHFLDLYSYLTNNYDYSYDINRLERGVVDSRRAGYKELFGEITFKSPRGTLRLNCTNGSNQGVEVIIEYGNTKLEIQESKGVVNVVENNETNNVPFEMKYQSNLSNEFVEDIITGDNCELPVYEESKILHKVFISAVLDHINLDNKEEITICPIT